MRKRGTTAQQLLMISLTGTAILMGGGLLQVAATRPPEIGPEDAFWRPLLLRQSVVDPRLGAAENVSSRSAGAACETYALHEPGVAVRVGDLNHNGLNDVALVTREDRLRIWLQNPICHELQEQTDMVTVPNPQDLAVDDLNDDDRADIVVVGAGRIGSKPPGVVSLVLQTSGGFTTEPITYTVGANPRRVRIGDVTSDGRPDIVVSSNSNLDVLIQQSDGSFSSTVVADPSMSVPYDVAIADFNGDGRNDIALQGSNRNPNVVVYPQKTDGSGFELGYFLSSLSTTFGGYGMTAGDVTGDGLADIVTTLPDNVPSARIVAYDQLPGGGLSAPSYLSTYECPVNPMLFDMDNDGQLDAVVLNNGYGSVTTHYQQAGGGLGPPVTVQADEVQSTFTRQCDAGEVTGDGQPDVVYSSLNTGLTLVLLGENSVPTCPEPVLPPRAREPVFEGGLLYGDWLSELVAGDIDNDGQQEFLTISMSGETVVKIAQQQPDNSYAFGDNIPVGRAFPHSLVSLCGLSTGDLDGDGWLDISVGRCSINSDEVVIVRRGVDGSFLPAELIEVDTSPLQTYIADWTGDGHDDLAVLAQGGLYVLAQQPDGMLGEPVQHLAGKIGSTRYSTVADWNRDGRMDLIAWWDDETQLTSRATNVRVFLQEADASFRMLPPTSFLPGPTDLQVGDVNGDGRPDVVVTSDGGNPFGVLGIMLQQADGSPGNRTLLSAPGYQRPGALAIADLNGDRLNDLLVMNSWTYLSVFTQNKQHTFDPVLYYNLGTLNSYWPHSVAQVDQDQDGFPKVIAIVSPDDYLVFLSPTPPRVFLPLVLHT
jgi:hypothetical protein